MHMPTERPGGSALRIDVVDERDHVVVALGGDVDVRSTQDVRAVIHELIDAHELVVLDMAGVDAIDLTALRLLAVATREAGRRGRRLRLRGCGPTVRRMIHLARLAHALDVERTLTSA